MAEWESSYGGGLLHNARILTREEIEKRYPYGSNSPMAELTREYVEKGYNILYAENPHPAHSILEALEEDLEYFCIQNICATAAHLYNVTPSDITIGCYTDMSECGAVYVAVKKGKYSSPNVFYIG